MLCELVSFFSPLFPLSLSLYLPFSLSLLFYSDSLTPSPSCVRVLNRVLLFPLVLFLPILHLSLTLALRASDFLLYICSFRVIQMQTVSLSPCAEDVEKGEGDRDEERESHISLRSHARSTHRHCLNYCRQIFFFMSISLINQPVLLNRVAFYY